MYSLYEVSGRRARPTAAQAILTFITITVVLSGMLYPVMARLHADAIAPRHALSLADTR